MKNWKIKIFFLGLVTSLIFLYHDSFTSRFFQDDRFLLNTASLDYFLRPVPDFHYHLISNQIFFLISKNLFGNNPLGFHLIEFIFIVSSIWLVYKISLLLTSNAAKSSIAAGYYALNVSLFSFYYWIASSYFIFGAFFSFLSIYFYIKDNRKFALLSFVAAMLSNEIAFTLPLILASLMLLSYRRNKILLALGFVDFIFLLLKTFWFKFPSSGEYSLTIGPGALKTFQWYVLRALNLPEGVRRIDHQALFLFWGCLVTILGLSFFLRLRRRIFPGRLIIVGSAILIFGALPFYFLPKHMSSYYLSIALLGPSLIVGEVVDRKILRLLLIITLAIVTFLGLQFLRGSHWIILKNTGPIGKF